MINGFWKTETTDFDRIQGGVFLTQWYNDL